MTCLARLAPLTLVLLAGCGDAKHEPVKVIAAPRAAPSEQSAPLPAPPPAVAVIAAAPSPPASAPTAAPPSRDVIRPGFIPGDAAPPRVRPGDPTGNDAFRRAVAARLAQPASAP